MTPAGPVLIRELDQTSSFSGNLTSWNQRIARIELAPGAPSFAAGTLIEFACGPMLFLGQVLDREGSQVSVVVEHSLDQQKLAWINKVWFPSERS